MNDKLSDELNHRIEQEAKDYANLEICDWGKIQGGDQLSKWELANDVYKDAAEKYAALWQAAEEKAARYEKALEAILNTNHDNYERVILKVKSLATDALTPKTII